jgi:hypothetical protein
VELTALLQYVANQLKASESLDLLVLKEVVVAMTGVQAVFDVSDAQMDALAGSDTLKAVVVTQAEAGAGGERDAQRGMQRLLRALRTGSVEQQLAVPMLVLLAQQRKLITLQPPSTHLKLVAELYDKCHEITLQYAELLRHALPRADYAALLPGIEVSWAQPGECRRLWAARCLRSSSSSCAHPRLCSRVWLRVSAPVRHACRTWRSSTAWTPRLCLSCTGPSSTASTRPARLWQTLRRRRRLRMARWLKGRRRHPAIPPALLPVSRRRERSPASRLGRLLRRSLTTLALRLRPWTSKTARWQQTQRRHLH